MKGSRATSVTADRAEGGPCADFVVLAYEGADYLVNTDEVVSSAIHGNEPDRQEGVQAIEYNGNTIPMISLDDHLARHFGETIRRKRRVILFVKGSDGRGPFPRVKRKSDGSGVDTSLIAVKSSGNVEMASLPLGELKPLPRSVQRVLRKRGVMAVRFTAGGRRPQYFIDIKTVVIMSIIQLHNRQARNENLDS